MRGVLFASLVLVLALGCGRDERTFETDDGAVTVSRDGDTVKLEMEGVKGAFGGDVKLPDDFPKDVPIPANATVVGAMDSPEGRMVHLQLDGSAGEAATFFEGALAEQGWEVENQMEVAGQHVFSSVKDGRVLNVQIGSQGDRTTAMLMIDEKP